MGLGDLDREEVGNGVEITLVYGWVFGWIGSECGIEVTWK